MRRVALAVLWTALVLGGCAPVDRASYDRIHEGMTYEEVVALLGQPTRSKSVGIGPLSGTTARWEGRQGVISIQFLNEKVKVKRFLSPDEVEPAGER